MAKIPFPKKPEHLPFYGMLVVRLSRRMPNHDFEITPNWRTISAPTRHPFVSLVVGQRDTTVRAEINIRAPGDKAETKRIHDLLLGSKDDIRRRFGSELKWRLSKSWSEASVGAGFGWKLEDQASWPDVADRLADLMVRVEEAFRPSLDSLVDDMPA